MPTTFRFNVPDITCYSCVNVIENVLKPRHYAIDQNGTNPFEQKIAVRVEDIDATNHPSEVIKHIQTLLNEVGLDSNVIDSKKDDDDQYVKKNHRKLIRHYLIKGILGTAFGLSFLALCLSGIAIPWIGMSGLSILSIVLTLGLGAETYFHAIKSFFKSKTFTMDSLFSISTLTTVAITFASLFKQGLPMMMEAGLLTFGFRYIGKAIEESIKKKISDKLLFQNRAPRFTERWIGDANQDANYITTNKYSQWRPIEIKDVAVGDIIRVKGGSVVPIDGVCISQRPRFINESTIRGATLPTLVKSGDDILAGVVVPAGDEDILLRVSRVQAQSHLAMLDKAMCDATETTAPIENTANKILKYFIPSILGLAALSGILVGAFFSPLLALKCAASVLVAACPCTLGFVTPLAIKVAMGKALNYGVRFKNGESLQKANHIDTVAFDLNGTLTQGKPRIAYYTIGDLVSKINEQTTANAETNFFNYLYHFEKRSNHPVAKLICDYIQNNKSNTISPLDIDDNLITHDHAGLHVRIGDDDYWVGNRSFLKANKITLPKQATNLMASQAAAGSVYLVKNGNLLGSIGIDDPLREEAIETIASLRKKNIAIHMITGADLKTARYYAKKLNIPLQNIHANCVDGLDIKKQQSKLAVLASIQRQGKKS